MAETKDLLKLMLLTLRKTYCWVKRRSVRINFKQPCRIDLQHYCQAFILFRVSNLRSFYIIIFLVRVSCDCTLDCCLQTLSIGDLNRTLIKLYLVFMMCTLLIFFFFETELTQFQTLANKFSPSYRSTLYQSGFNQRNRTTRICIYISDFISLFL